MTTRGTEEWRKNISKSLKGRTVWNKGTKGLVKPNKGSFKKGQIPFNKGKKGVMPTPWNKGVPISEETRQKIRSTRKNREDSYNYPAKEKHWNWKADDVGYRAVHRWLVRTYGRSNICEKCLQKPGLTKNGKSKIQWANKTGKYLRDREDWIQLCISCHWKYDKRVENLKKQKATS